METVAHNPPPLDPQDDADASAGASNKAYSIGTVARLAGVPIETVRIWERRYDLLRPARTQGGHRLYSDADVTLLRAVKSLVDDGLRPGEVFRLGHERLLELAGARTQRVTPNWKDAIDAVIDAGLKLDETRVGALLDGSLTTCTQDEVIEGLWMPVLARVGELWEQGQLPIAVEHFLQQQITTRVQSAFRAALSQTGPVVLCACAPDDRHEVGLFASALALKRAGFSPLVLGADVPAVELEKAATTAKAELLVLSVTASLSREASRTLPVVLERAPLLKLPLLMGGQNVSQLRALLRRPHVVVTQVSELPAMARSVLKTDAR